MCSDKIIHEMPRVSCLAQYFSYNLARLPKIFVMILQAKFLLAQYFTYDLARLPRVHVMIFHAKSINISI